MEPVTVPVSEACRIVGIGKTLMFELIADGTVETIKLGRRRLVKTSSLRKLAEAA
jgi:excisionase family DNA binding protein